MKREHFKEPAILMIALGEELAAEVIKHLSAAEVQALGAVMATTTQVTRSDLNKVMERFRDESEQYLAVSLGSESYVREMLTRALGADRAAEYLEDILENGSKDNGIDALNELDPASIAEIIGDEHPQIIATILVHLEPARAGGVISCLSERLRMDVTKRIACFVGVQPSALFELTDSLNNVLSGQTAKRSKLGGVRTAAEILNTMKGQDESDIIAGLHEQDPELAQRIQDEMFVFDNITGLEDSAIQLIMREVDASMWPIALKGAKQELIDRILGNMSSRQSEMIRDDINDQGPLRLSVVEAEQKKILDIARKLADSGQIQLHSAVEDAYV